MLDGFASEQSIQVGFQIVLDRRVPEVLQKRFELRDAGFVIVELGVNLEAPASLQHQRFAHGFVIAQRDERFTHARNRKDVALADFYRRRVVREAEAD